MENIESKSMFKSNQILPITQEYFGKFIILTRIKLMDYMFHDLQHSFKPKSVIRLWVDCPLMSCGLLFGLQKA